MSKWRKKPIVIDAVEWKIMGDHPAVERPWTDYDNAYSKWRRGLPVDECPNCVHPWDAHGTIRTLEDMPNGGHFVCPGDWIITGVQGEVYPCKPGIFAATYEPVELERDGVDLNNMRQPAPALPAPEPPPYKGPVSENEATRALAIALAEGFREQGINTTDSAAALIAQRDELVGQVARLRGALEDVALVCGAKAADRIRAFLREVA